MAVRDVQAGGHPGCKRVPVRAKLGQTKVAPSASSNDAPGCLGLAVAAGRLLLGQLLQGRDCLSVYLTDALQLRSMCESLLLQLVFLLL